MRIDLEKIINRIIIILYYIKNICFKKVINNITIRLFNNHNTNIINDKLNMDMQHKNYI